MKKLTPAQIKALQKFASGTRGCTTATTVYAMIRLGLLEKANTNAGYQLTDAGKVAAEALGFITPVAVIERPHGWITYNLKTVTPEIITREASYRLTKYTPADVETIRAIANELDALAENYESLNSTVMTWLEVNAPEATTIFAKYEVQSAVELAEVATNNYAYSTATKTGGFEKYPLSTWKTWINKNKAIIKKLQAAFDYAKVDMVSQATNVNWWVN